MIQHGKENKVERDLSINTLCGGAVQEKINRALRRVSDNILDPNTEAKKKRKIVLELTFEPNEDDREDVSVDASVTWKLAPEEKSHTQIFISHDANRDTVTITEHVKGQLRGQMSLDDFGLTTEDFDPDTGEIKPSNVREFPNRVVNQ